MADWIAQHFYWLDLAIGAAAPVSVGLLRQTGRLSRLSWRLFWLGCAIGLAWEIPLSTLDGLGVVDVFTFQAPPPVHFTVIIASHTLWDGGLFLVGVLLVRLLCRAPHFQTFRPAELGVLLAWGQLQELGVELLAMGTAGWTYRPAAWNPPLFAFRGHSITLLPQLIWLAAVPVFYGLALRLARWRRPA